MLASVTLVLLVPGSISLWVYWRARASLPQLDGTITVTGISAPVEVKRDARGVPHVRAQSLEDGLFAQGYVTAQDRLWQMDLTRRLAAGELSEILGERTIRLDIENRTLGLRQMEERSLQEMDEESHRRLSAYARGVNAFIESHLDRLPIEFLILRYRPRPWREADSVGVALNMAKALSTSWPEDLMREHVRARLTPELYEDVFPDHSPLDRPVAELPPAKGHSPKLPSSTELPPLLGLPFLLGELTATGGDVPRGLGSNNWVISGSHTRSEKPLLANDPHLGHGIPSVWYMIHLTAPGINVSGVSFPGLPAVIIGHNEKIAWGVTNTNTDVQDLYVERFDPTDRSKYLHDGQWVSAELRTEVIKVRAKPDFYLQVKVTRHGPIISHDGGRDLALRWTLLEPQGFGFPFLEIDRAQNWTEFVAALRDFHGPMQNFVFADADGNIGYYAPARVSIRRQGDGTVPADGSIDDFDWAGYIPFEELPHAFNPPGGIIATANGRVVPDGYPYLITHRWAEPYRTARIFELLESGNQLTVADMLRVQIDIHSMEDQTLAKYLVKAGAARPPKDPEVQYALGLLRSYDGEARRDSAATLISEQTRQALFARILKPKLGDNLAGYSWPMASTFLENVLSGRPARWLPPGDADFDETLMRALESAVAEIPKVVGRSEHSAWNWGQTLPLTFYHPLGRGSAFLGRFFNVGPFPQAGTATTINANGRGSGPSMRMIVDMADFDGSALNITLGESGQVTSPYYRDQFEVWYTGQSFPMLFSDSAVARGTVHRLVLQPAN
jgi:penicillin amidase